MLASVYGKRLAYIVNKDCWDGGSSKSYSIRRGARTSLSLELIDPIVAADVFTTSNLSHLVDPTLICVELRDALLSQLTAKHSVSAAGLDGPQDPALSHAYDARSFCCLQPNFELCSNLSLVQRHHFGTDSVNIDIHCSLSPSALLVTMVTYSTL